RENAMSKTHFCMKQIATRLLVFAGFAGLLAIGITPARAQTLTILHSFSGGADGQYTNSGLVMDAQGNLYGTTRTGGIYGHGSVYEVTPSGTLTTAYSFSGGADGSEPWGDLIIDSQGNLYGATAIGGAYDSGTIFEL